MEKQGLSRRSFVAGGVGMAALAGIAGLTGCGSNASGKTSSNIKWDDEAEILVVGSGYSALAAAIEAHSAGASVRIIDKRSMSGGNSSIADGDFAVCGSSAQAAQGVKDSVDDYVKDMLVAGLYLNDVEKCRLLAEKTNETWEWLNGFGVEWVKNDQGNIELLPYGGHTNYRTMKPVGAGGAIVTALNTKVKELGMSVETNTMLTGIIQDETGRVIGIEARKKVKDNDSNSGDPLNIKVKKALILATGGFGRDIPWRMQHDPRLDDKMSSTNREGSTSEALQAAIRIGALPVHLDWIQLGPWCSPDEELGAAWTYIDSGFPYGPVVAPQTGKRIVNELTDRKRYCDAIIANEEPLIQIVDKRNLPDWSMEYLKKCLEYGCTWELNSIEEIAAKFSIPLEALQAEIARYNTFVANKVDEDFGKKIPQNALPVLEPPYCVTRIWPKVHHCMGGVKTGLDAGVIDVALNQIPGFYSAGEATGGIHGACRLGSCATADCLVNGRIAGQSAAALDSWC